MRAATEFPFFTIGLILLAFTFLFGLAFITKGGEILADYQSCQPPISPFKVWCPRGNITSIYDKIASNSVQALACAVGSAGGGEVLREETCPREIVRAGFGSVLAQDNEKCYGDTCVTCSSNTDGTVACTVNNFHLPQDVTDAQKYIAGYGDPEYKVYWQSFPEEESAAWSGYRTGLDNVVTVAMFALPFGAAGRTVFQGGKAAFAGTFKASGSFLTTKSRRLLGRIFSKAGVREENQLVFAFMKGTPKRQRITNIHAAFKDSQFYKGMVEAIEKRHTQKDIRNIIVAAGVTSVAEIPAAILDSMNEGTIPEPGHILLKSPFQSPKPFDLSLPSDQQYESIERSRMPVILDKKGALQTTPTFYLASPCQADLSVRIGTAQCDVYEYNELTGDVVCSGPKIISKDEDVPLCHFVDEGELAAPFATSTIHGFTLQLLQDRPRRKLFEYDSEGKLTTIHFPLPSIFHNKNIFLKDITLLESALIPETPVKRFPKSESTPLTYIIPPSKTLRYRGTLSSGGLTKAPIPATKKEDVLMVNTERYVVHMYRIPGGLDDVLIDIYPVSLCEAGGILSNSARPFMHMGCEEIISIWEDQGSHPIQAVQYIRAKTEEVYDTGIPLKFAFLSPPGRPTITAEDLIDTDDGWGFGTIDSPNKECAGPFHAQCFRSVKEVQFDIFCTAEAVESPTDENDVYTDFFCSLISSPHLFLPPLFPPNVYLPTSGLDVFDLGELNDKVRYTFRGDPETAYLYKQTAVTPGDDWRLEFHLSDDTDDQVLDTIDLRIRTGTFGGSVTYSVSDLNGDGIKDALGTQDCKVPAILVSSNEEEYGRGSNFCHAKASLTAKVIAVGAIVTDAVLIAVSAGTLTVVAVGVTAGAAYLIASSAERWPG